MLLKGGPRPTAGLLPPRFSLSGISAAAQLDARPTSIRFCQPDMSLSRSSGFIVLRVSLPMESAPDLGLTGLSP